MAEGIGVGVLVGVAVEPGGGVTVGVLLGPPGVFEGDGGSGVLVGGCAPVTVGVGVLVALPAGQSPVQNTAPQVPPSTGTAFKSI